VEEIGADSSRPWPLEGPDQRGVVVFSCAEAGLPWVGGVLTVAGGVISRRTAAAWFEQDACVAGKTLHRRREKHPGVFDATALFDFVKRTGGQSGGGGERSG
jgi:hypothetical protein